MLERSSHSQLAPRIVRITSQPERMPAATNSRAGRRRAAALASTSTGTQIAAMIRRPVVWHEASAMKQPLTSTSSGKSRFRRRHVADRRSHRSRRRERHRAVRARQRQQPAQPAQRLGGCATAARGHRDAAVRSPHRRRGGTRRSYARAPFRHTAAGAAAGSCDALDRCAARSRSPPARLFWRKHGKRGRARRRGRAARPRRAPSFRAAAGPISPAPRACRASPPPRC